MLIPHSKGFDRWCRIAVGSMETRSHLVWTWKPGGFPKGLTPKLRSERWVRAGTKARGQVDQTWGARWSLGGSRVALWEVSFNLQKRFYITWSPVGVTEMFLKGNGMISMCAWKANQAAGCRPVRNSDPGIRNLVWSALQWPETRITQLGDVNGTERTRWILTYFGDTVFLKSGHKYSFPF